MLWPIIYSHKNVRLGYGLKVWPHHAVEHFKCGILNPWAEELSKGPGLNEAGAGLQDPTH